MIISFFKFLSLRVQLFFRLSLSAFKQLTKKEAYTLDNVEFHNPLIIPEGQTRIVQTIIHMPENGKRLFEIQSSAQEETKVWTKHMQGWVQEGIKEPLPTTSSQ